MQVHCTTLTGSAVINYEIAILQISEKLIRKSFCAMIPLSGSLGEMNEMNESIWTHMWNMSHARIWM
ncbi:unnamed protein product [Onchocerca flexuosa]|uniref:Uncharacterized protein n=1 Tax=Onchocerca flexuosa TaxID=387005 RepID=A0A183I0J6_9BILA|nr:unnamed protein product [Onchocerca flexuosa]